MRSMPDLTDGYAMVPLREYNAFRAWVESGRPRNQSSANTVNVTPAVEEPRRDPNRLLNKRDIADLLQSCVSRIDKMMANGTIPAPIKIGTSVRWKPEVIDGWIAAGCPRPDGKSSARSRGDA